MNKILLILCMCLAAEISAAPEAFIVNSLAETLSKINLQTDAVQNHIVTLGDTPNEVAYHDGYLYVVNSVSADMQKIDPLNYQIVADIPFVVGSNPYSVAFNGNYAFVSGWASGFVYRANLATNEVDNQILIGGFPEGLIVSGGKLFVTQTAFNPNDFSYGQGRMAIIDPNTMILDDEIDIGKNPQSFVAISDTIIHAVCTGDYGSVGGAIYMINTRTEIITDSLLIGGQPVNGAVAPGNIVILAGGGWENYGIVMVYNANTGQIINGVSNPIVAGLGVADVAVDSEGTIYTCDFGDDTVSKISRHGPPFLPFAVGDGPLSIVIVGGRATPITDEPIPIPGEPTLLSNYPNPFNSQTIIRLSPLGTLRANLEIFDIRGLMVTLIPVENGSDRVVWDGFNQRGQACAAGVYIARLVMPDDVGKGGYTSNTLRLVYVK